MSAFEQLVYRYDKQVFAIAARYCQCSDDAKDVYQEVFLRVYNGLKKFEARSEFSTWLYRITTNVCLTHRSRQKRHTRTADADDPDSGDAHAASTDPSPEQHAVDADIGEKIREALTTLSSQQRLVFTLRHYEGYKLKDIAGMMKCTEGTVKRYLFTATQRMRGQLNDLYES